MLKSKGVPYDCQRLTGMPPGKIECVINGRDKDRSDNVSMSQEQTLFDLF
jgi:hypothetical protein